MLFNKSLRKGSIIAILFLLAIQVRGSEGDTTLTNLFEMSIEELIEQEVTIATKSEQTIGQTPSVVSVVTSQEIKAMGFKDMQDLLQSIPGIEFTQTRIGARSGGARGVADTRIGGRVLVLLDGTPYNDVMYGSALYFGGEFNLDNIERVEVIRGPGSALYGRNAFSLVVNIITKKASRDNQAEAVVYGGSYQTFGAQASYGMKKEKLDGFISFKYFTTDGTDSKFDNGMGGESIWNLKHDNYYLNTNFQYKDFQFFGSLIKRVDGNSSGPFMTDCFSTSKIGTYNLQYKKSLSSKTKIKAKLYGQNVNRIQLIEQYKPNTTALHPIYGVPIMLLAPEGVYAKPVFDEYLYGGEIEFDWKLFKNNNLLFGIQADMHGVQNATVTANYDLMTNFPLTYTEGTEVRYYSKDNMPLYDKGWILDNGHDYRNAAFYFQDIFYPIDNLGFTIGGRLDMDSETGLIFNPRLGIVWEPMSNIYCKLLYGKAYRTPTTNEQYKIMGFDKGNKDLKYEEIRTTEFVIGGNIKKFYFQLSTYYNKLNNLILQQYVNDTSNIYSYFNNGKNTSYGLEVESKLFLLKELYSFINFSYVNSENIKLVFGQKVTSPQAGLAEYIVNFGFNYSFLKYFSYNFYLNYTGPINKFEDARPNAPSKYVAQDKVGDFFIANSSLRINNLIKGFDLAIYGYNLFNTTYYFQDDINAYQPAQPGINFLVKASYSF